MLILLYNFFLFLFFSFFFVWHLPRILSDALALFDEMGVLGLERDIQVYTNLMKALLSGGQINEAYNLFQSMKNERIQIEIEKEYGNDKKEKQDDEIYYQEIPLEIDIIAYNTLLHGLCDFGEFKRALQIFGEMNALEAKEQQEFIQQQRQQKQSNTFLHFPINENNSTKKLFVCDLKAYTTIIAGLVQKHHRIIKDSGNTEGVFNVQDKDDQEIELWKTKKGEPKLAIPYDDMIQNIEIAWKIFDNAKKLDLQFDTRIYATMLEGLSRIENGADRAQTLYRDMQRLDSLTVDGHTYRAMIEAGCNEQTDEGDTRAIHYFELMLKNWEEKGIQDRDVSKAEDLLETRLGETGWVQVALKHKDTLEDIYLGSGHTSLVRLPRILRADFNLYDFAVDEHEESALLPELYRDGKR